MKILGGCFEVSRRDLYIDVPTWGGRKDAWELVRDTARLIVRRLHTIIDGTGRSGWMYLHCEGKGPQFNRRDEYGRGMITHFSFCANVEDAVRDKTDSNSCDECICCPVLRSCPPSTCNWQTQWTWTMVRRKERMRAEDVPAGDQTSLG